MKRDELLAAAQEYSRKAREWFLDGQEALRAKEQEILTQAKLNAPGLKETITNLTELVRSLRQDRDLVHQHLHDALAPPSTDQQASASPPAGASLPAALLAMDRSINGWLRLKEFFPEREDEVLDLLVCLDRLRRAVVNEFPQGR